MTPTEVAQPVGYTAAEIAEIRQNADSDVFYFGIVICGHKDLVFEDHAPLMYAAAGDGARLIAVLRSPLNSYTVRQFRKECSRQSIDIWAHDAAEKMSEKLRVVDLRVYRGSGKSSALTHAVRLWKMVRWPDMSSALITNVEKPKARDFGKQIRATIQSDIFAAVYPDRLPSDPKTMLTENSLTLAGRMVPDKEPCLMVFGYGASPTGYHFDELQFDDLVGRENKSATDLAVVRDFLSNVQELYNPGIRFPLRRIHVGTRWDEEDDSYEVRRYSQAFPITIPIWYRDKPADDIRVPGIPTTQWMPLEKIRAKQEETLSNPDEGGMSWRCNSELDPTVAGGRIFPAEMVDDAQWVPFSGPDPAKKYVQRPQYDADGKRLDKARAFDIDGLYKVICCDQSFSESESADVWAVVCIGMDQYGHRFMLDQRTGKGLESMLDGIVTLRQQWKPWRVGMEKIAAQKAIELVLKLSDKYRVLRNAVEPVDHKNQQKEWRIRNYVAEVMRMHRLWLHPRDLETTVEMKKYKPGPKAIDNILDAMAMCEVLIRKSLAPKDEEEDYRKKFARINNRNKARRDQSTGVALW